MPRAATANRIYCELLFAPADFNLPSEPPAWQGLSKVAPINSVRQGLNWNQRRRGFTGSAGVGSVGHDGILRKGGCRENRRRILHSKEVSDEVPKITRPIPGIVPRR